VALRCHDASQEAAFSGVIGGKGVFDEFLFIGRIVAEQPLEPGQVPGAGMDVLFRVQGVADAVFAGRAGHELHQAARTPGGNGLDAEFGLLPYDCGQQFPVPS